MNKVYKQTIHSIIFGICAGIIWRVGNESLIIGLLSIIIVLIFYSITNISKK